MAMLPRVHPHSTDTACTGITECGYHEPLSGACFPEAPPVCSPKSLDYHCRVSRLAIDSFLDMDCFFVVHMSWIVIVFTWSMHSCSQSFEHRILGCSACWETQVLTPKEIPPNDQVKFDARLYYIRKSEVACVHCCWCAILEHGEECSG
jgi:hypothetical protein